MDRWTDGYIRRKTDAQEDKYFGRCIDGQTKQYKDRQTYRRNDGPRSNYRGRQAEIDVQVKKDRDIQAGLKTEKNTALALPGLPPARE